MCTSRLPPGVHPNILEGLALLLMVDLSNDHLQVLLDWLEENSLEFIWGTINLKDSPGFGPVTYRVKGIGRYGFHHWDEEFISANSKVIEKREIQTPDGPEFICRHAITSVFQWTPSGPTWRIMESWPSLFRSSSFTNKLGKLVMYSEMEAICFGRLKNEQGELID